MLARWDHPRHGLVSPEVFIPLAEQAGLMATLTTHILNLALQHCATWRAEGLQVNVAVNLSASSLVDLNLGALVGALLARWDVPAELLTLEITEGTVMADPDVAIGVLQSLRDLGIRLSVDDFGVGYSSLANLNRMPVQEVKIDRTFVQNLSESVDSAVITRSIVDLGRNLALDVVAEGVEDLQAWDLLAAMNCQYAQGYFLARPMPPERFAAWHAQWIPPWLATKPTGWAQTTAVVPSPR